MNEITSPAGRPIRTLAGQQIFTNAITRDLYAALINARPHLLPILAKGSKAAMNAQMALGIMIGYELASIAGDVINADVHSREFDALVERIGYNPLDRPKH
jgi:hypothetical protein